MEKKDVNLENFKQALTSTIKSISERNDFNISFGKETIKEQKNVNLPEIKKLENFQDFLQIRAKADSEALRIKHCDIDIFNTYKPKGKMASKLYEIAEKIRYEKIGSDNFRGIRENLSKNYKKIKEKSNSGEDKDSNDGFIKKFEDSLRDIIFKGEKNNNNLQRSKRKKKSWERSLKQNINLLRSN